MIAAGNAISNSQIHKLIIINNFLSLLARKCLRQSHPNLAHIVQKTVTKLHL